MIEIKTAIFIATNLLRNNIEANVYFLAESSIRKNKSRKTHFFWTFNRKN